MSTQNSWNDKEITGLLCFVEHFMSSTWILMASFLNVQNPRYNLLYTVCASCSSLFQQLKNEYLLKISKQRLS